MSPRLSGAGFPLLSDIETGGGDASDRLAVPMGFSIRKDSDSREEHGRILGRYVQNHGAVMTLTLLARLPESQTSHNQRSSTPPFTGINLLATTVLTYYKERGRIFRFITLWQQKPA